MIDVDDLRRKWEGYQARLKEGDGDGSLVGASFIIAHSGATDVLGMLNEVKRLQEIERTAHGVVRTSHPVEIHHAVVSQWWDALKDALELP